MKPSDIELIFSRRHPEYRAHESRWRLCRDAYSGGAAYIDRALVRHVSELELEFEERRRRAYYFNYPRAIARRITQYLLASDPVRRGADPELVADWSLTGLRVNEVMRQLSTVLNVYGRGWLLVEAPNFRGRPSLAEARRKRLRPYVRALAPLAVTDWAVAPDGRLLWAIVAEEEFCNRDPFSPPEIRRCRRLYERDRWRLFAETAEGVREIASGRNPAGAVPLVAVTEPDGFGLEANHWFEDVERISRAILNNESEAQMNVVKQMFGLLVISDSFARGARKQAQMNRGENGEGTFAATLARSAAVIESVEEKGISRFISPSGVETATIRSENIRLKEELYEVVGLSIQRYASDSRTAAAKEWDFHHTARFLASRAELLEQSEVAAWQLIHAFDPAIAVPEITYCRNFAVRDLASSIAALLDLASLTEGEEFRRAVRRAALEMLHELQPLPGADREKIFAEIAASPASEPATQPKDSRP